MKDIGVSDEDIENCVREPVIIDYIESNNTWIKMIDKAAGCVGEEETVKLCKVFKTCAVYENLFWYALDRKKCIDF